jgi:hypothetical protein
MNGGEAAAAIPGSGEQPRVDHAPQSRQPEVTTYATHRRAPDPAPATSPSSAPVNDGAGEGEGGQRKGWWKRLTE